MTKKKRGSPLPYILGLLAGLIAGWLIFPQVLFSERDQPIHFSHKVHMAEKLEQECESCHHYRNDGSYAGIPKLETCTTEPSCHFEPLTSLPSEEKFFNEYVKKNRPIPWKIYQSQPDNVYFSHIAHEEYECTECHPDVGEAEDMPTHYENKLTGYSKLTMTMDECELCHAKENASNACFICHK